MKPCQVTFPLATAGVLLVVCLGCGGAADYGPTGTIQGKLTMEGEPLPEGTQVVFMHPEKGYAAFGGTDAEGNYEVTSWNNGNIPIGKYQVMIQPSTGTESVAEPSAEDLLDNPEKFEQAPESSFPRKYRQTNSSGLEYQVNEGENTIDVDIRSS